jgi:hypothetical protein
LVNLVEDWDVMEEYSGQVKHGYYQVMDSGDLVELRVQLGRLGFIKEFKENTDPLLTRILTFCKNRKYFIVTKTVRDELFFK